MASDNPLVRLGALGQSPWYDFITRELIATGELRALISNDGLLGMTSNPTIFEKAIAGSADYDDDIRRLAADGRGAEDIFEALAISDVRAACDAFQSVYAADGRARRAGFPGGLARRWRATVRPPRPRRGGSGPRWTAPT